MNIMPRRELERLWLMEKCKTYSRKAWAFQVMLTNVLYRIDMPVIKWAQKVVAKAKAGGMELPEFGEKEATDKNKNTKTK